MGSVVASKKTSDGYEDVIVGALRFFPLEGWRPTGQSARTATFFGRPEVPWRDVALTAAGYLAFVVPGVFLHHRKIRRRYGYSNIVVSATPVKGGTQVTVEYPLPAEPLAQRFVEMLPPSEPI